MLHVFWSRKRTPSYQVVSILLFLSVTTSELWPFTHRSEEPVSKSSRTSWPGVPIDTGLSHSRSSVWLYAATSPTKRYVSGLYRKNYGWQTRTQALVRGKLGQRVRNRQPIFGQRPKFRSGTATLDVGVTVGTDGERSGIVTFDAAQVEGR